MQKASPHEGRSSPRPVIICGVGRSGTSLMQSMMASHSRMAFLPETAFFRRYVVGSRLGRALAGQGEEAVRRLVEEDERLRFLGIDADIVLAWGRASGEDVDAAVYRALLGHAASGEGKTHVGDKDPRMVEYLPVLHRVLPGAVIVHMIRDPRDVLASKKKAAWSRDRSVYEHLMAGYVQFRVGRRDGRRLYGPAYLEVFYEDLLAEPERELRRVCRALDLPYEAGMLDFGDTARQLVRPGEVAWKRETFGPLLQGNAGKWASSLSAWEAALTEQVCAACFAPRGRYPRTRHDELPDRLRGGLAAVVGLGVRAAGFLYGVLRARSLRRAIHRIGGGG